MRWWAGWRRRCSGVRRRSRRGGRTGADRREPLVGATGLRRCATSRGGVLVFGTCICAACALDEAAITAERARSAHSGRSHGATKRRSLPRQECLMPHPFKLPDLPYAFDALEPHIDARTMEIHHDKHHAAYTNKLNEALEKHPQFQDKSIEELLRGIEGIPEDIRTAVRNNGGGYANHAMFWEIMGPGGGGEPTGALADAIAKKFGSFSD